MNWRYDVFDIGRTYKCLIYFAVDVDEDEPSMTEEIFGPIIPIFSVKNHRDAIDFINSRFDIDKY
jgi:acyl-CoA reductase-like NAD-dependent aldehyde dehydrogenase